MHIYSYTAELLGFTYKSDLKLVFGIGQRVHCTQITRPQSPDIKPAERLWDVVKQQSLVRKPTNLQKLCDAILSIWIKICEDSFQHLGELTRF